MKFDIENARLTCFDIQFASLLKYNIELANCLIRGISPLFLYSMNFNNFFYFTAPMKRSNCPHLILYHRLDPIGSPNLFPVRLPPSVLLLATKNRTPAPPPLTKNRTPTPFAATAESPPLPPLPSSPCRRRPTRPHGGPGGPLLGLAEARRLCCLAHRPR